MKNNQKGFGAVEGLLILVIVGLIGFIGWYVWHTKSQTDKSLNTAASTSATTKVATKTTDTSAATEPQTEYLEVSQFGVKIPLTSAISDLTYKNYGLYSVSILPNKIRQIAPNCIPVGTPWNTLRVISTTAPINGDADATVTIKGTIYYLFAKGGSAPCPDSPEHTLTASEQSQINAAVSDYTKAMVTAFSNATAM